MLNIWTLVQGFSNCDTQHLWYIEGCYVVLHKVYKNIKHKNQTKQPFLLKVMNNEQRSEYCI